MPTITDAQSAVILSSQSQAVERLSRTTCSMPTRKQETEAFSAQLQVAYYIEISTAKTFWRTMETGMKSDASTKYRWKGDASQSRQCRGICLSRRLCRSIPSLLIAASRTTPPLALSRFIAKLTSATKYRSKLPS